MTERMVALLGRRDEPTDGVEDYCRYLGAALRAHEFDLEIVRVPWAEKGWVAALREVAQSAASWRGIWVCMHYTALAWSARGFPLRLLSVLSALRRAGARVAIVFHDVKPYPGRGFLHRARSIVQLRIMRKLLRGSDLAIFTLPLHTITWLGTTPHNAAFICVGASLLPTASKGGKHSNNSLPVPRVAVYGITGGEVGRRESARIVDALRFAASKMGKVELRAFGRHAEDCELMLREALHDVPVDVRVRGVLPAEEVAEELSASDVLLFLRGPISAQRSSAIAGIACGLPVIAERGPQTTGPIEEAGVVLVSADDAEGLRNALWEVLAKPEYRAQLAGKSQFAYEKYFSWQAIAARYAETLQKTK